nr:hypothetical protein [Sphingopyxis sp. YR583]
MAQQQAFMAWALPDERQPLISCKLSSALVALRRLAELVGIEKHEMVRIGFAVADGAARDFAHGFFNDRKRIAPSWLKQHRVEMNLQSGGIGKSLEERGIALFALPLATDEQTGAQQALAPTRKGARRPHPMLGTAP